MSRDLSASVVHVGEDGELLLRLKRADGSLLSIPLAPAEAIAIAADLLQAARTHMGRSTDDRSAWAKLTPKRQRFIQEYLVDLNATQAAARAGYSEKTADRQGSRLLKNAEVAEAVKLAQESRSKATGITAERIVAELAKLGFANMEDYYYIDANGTPRLCLEAINRDDAAAIKELMVEESQVGDEAVVVRKIRMKLHSKREALVDLGRHLGMFKEEAERPEVNVQILIKNA
jgi:phage terminase small subunit